MFCHQCGAKAYGNYCAQCGTRLVSAAADALAPPQDWSHEIRYEVLLRIPEVRNSIAHHASQAAKSATAQEFLALCDTAFVPLTGVSLSKIGAIVQPIYRALGVKTGKSRKEMLPPLAGKILVSALCSLARRGYGLARVEQGEDGCFLRATIPSDMWSFQGDLLITVQRDHEGTLVEAATTIKGQFYDWGKSKRCLNALFEDLIGIPS